MHDVHLYCPCRYVRALRSSFADQHDAMKKSAQGVWVAQLKVLDNEEEEEEGGGWVGGWVLWGREGGKLESWWREKVAGE